MTKLQDLKPQRVFHYFEELSAIPRGSGNMERISQYCIDFAKKHNLRYHTDDAKNVVIFKAGSDGYENSQPVILQGHLDMVCQKTADCNIDFLNDGLELYVDGDYVKAKGTTLGADNGIAVAMVLAVLENDNIAHPPIEAVFTTDEETGMNGAMALDMSVLQGTRMINLDSEEDDCITVSCAGGSDLVITKKLCYKAVEGTKIKIELSGLLGGHSGVEIHKNRTNADILMGKILDGIKNVCDFELISINGGDKANAIPNYCKAELCVADADDFIKSTNEIISGIKAEIVKNEKDFSPAVTVLSTGEFEVIDSDIKDKLIYALCNTKNGVIKMSDDIDNLVETSLNLGILSTGDDSLVMHFALRSNKNDGLYGLEKECVKFFEKSGFETEAFGHYPPWEYREDSTLRELYKETYNEHFSKDVRVEALHAGLECGVFASSIENIDCIAVGPTIYDVHTVNEKLSISSCSNLYDILVEILAKLK